MSSIVLDLSQCRMSAWASFLASSLGRRPPLWPRARGRVEPGPGPLADEVPLELGQGGEDVEDQLAAAGGRVDALPEALEPDPPLPEGGERLDEVAERPA